MIAETVDFTPAESRARVPALDSHAVGQHAMHDPQPGESGAHGSDPVALFNAQLLRAPHDRLARRTGGGDEQYRKFVDGERHELHGNLDAAQGRRMHQ